MPADLRDLVNITLFATRIGGKILAFGKLRGVGKNSRYHPISTAQSGFNQRNMPAMQIAHGWHQPDRQPLPAPEFNLTAHLRDCIKARNRFHHFIRGVATPSILQICCSFARAPPLQSALLAA